MYLCTYTIVNLSPTQPPTHPFLKHFLSQTHLWEVQDRFHLPAEAEAAKWSPH